MVPGLVVNAQAWQAGPVFPSAQMGLGWGGDPKDQSFWPVFRQSPQIFLVAMAEDRQLPDRVTGSSAPPCRQIAKGPWGSRTQVAKGEPKLRAPPCAAQGGLALGLPEPVGFGQCRAGHSSRLQSWRLGRGGLGPRTAEGSFPV